MPTLPPPVALLEARLGLAEGSLEDEDLARAEAALEDAATLILAEVADSKATIWAVDAPKVAELVALKAARREFENPQGLASETVGDRAVGMSETSGVFLTGRELALIRRAASGRSGGFLGSVRTPSAYRNGVPTWLP